MSVASAICTVPERATWDTKWCVLSADLMTSLTKPKDFFMYLIIISWIRRATASGIKLSEKNSMQWWSSLTSGTCFCALHFVDNTFLKRDFINARNVVNFLFLFKQNPGSAAISVILITTLSKSARTQREECACPLVALFLNIVSFELLISRTRKIRGFWNLRIVLSNGKMHFEKEKHDILREKCVWTFNLNFRPEERVSE